MIFMDDTKYLWSTMVKSYLDPKPKNPKISLCKLKHSREVID